MATSTISQYITHGVYPGTGTYAANISVTSLGTINTGSNFALSFKASGYLINDGLIKGNYYYSVGLSASGGTITNAGSASIYGSVDGIFNKSSKTGDSVTVANFGTITGNDQYGIKVTDAGIITNTGTASLIIGGDGGITGWGGALTVTNQGAIKGVQQDGIRLNGGGTVTNSGTQSYVYGDFNGVYAKKIAAITNAGTMIGDIYGVYLTDGGTVTNTGTDALIFGTDSAVGFVKAGTVVNNGILTGQTLYGVSMQDGGVITNAGTISGAHDAIYVTSGKFTLHVDPGAVFAGNVLDQGGGGTLALGGTASGSLAIDATGNSFTGIGSINFATGASWTLAGNVGDLASGQTMTGFASADTIDLTGIGLATAETFANDVLTLTSGGNTYKLDITPSVAPDFKLLSDGNGGTDIVICFAAGTRIGTPDGEVPVERLQIGDRAATVAGGTRPIIWIGRRRVDLTRHADPMRVRPIRIAAGAFADGTPHRDLLVSPDHAVVFDGRLIPAKLLVNGASIAPDTICREMTYFHVELDSHDILLAEGLPAESYLDTGNRAMFENGGQPMVLHPDFGTGQQLRVSQSCLPFADRPDQVEPVWRALAERAEALGWVLPRPVLTEDPDLHLLVGTRRIDPVAVQGRLYTFVVPQGMPQGMPQRMPQGILKGVPPGNTPIRLSSRAACPREAWPWIADDRRLGTMVRRLACRSGHDVLNVAMDDPTLVQGWWAVERDDGGTGRWTDGGAVLPNLGAGVLEVELGGRMRYRVEGPGVAGGSASRTAAA
jgi:hypothetical protein